MLKAIGACTKASSARTTPKEKRSCKLSGVSDLDFLLHKQETLKLL